MMQRAKAVGVEVMMLTVDSITGGNRERDKRTGCAIPFKLNLAGMLQFALKPGWAINYFTHEGFKLPDSTSMSTWAAARCRSAATSPECSIRR